MNILAPFNYLIKLAGDAGIGGLIYQLWNIVNIAVVSAFCLIYRKHYEIKRGHAIAIPILGYFLGDVLILVFGAIAAGWFNGSNNIVKGFSFFPLIGLLLAKIFRLDWKRVMDFSAPAFPLLQCVAHIACNFGGCCYGYPLKNGVYNPIFHQYLFPTQLLESLVSLIVFFVCLRYARSTKYKVTGRVYPLFLVTFGATRFFLEFLRNNNKVFLGISNLALWALLMVVVGTAWFIIDNRNTVKKQKSKA